RFHQPVHPDRHHARRQAAGHQRLESARSPEERSQLPAYSHPSHFRRGERSAGAQTGSPQLPAETARKRGAGRSFRGYPVLQPERVAAHPRGGRQRAGCLADLQDAAKRQYEGHRCPYGPKALEETDIKAFDCIILDYTLPDISGVDLINRVSENKKKLTPVIVYSAKDFNKKELYHLNRSSNTVLLKGVNSLEHLLE